MDDTLLISLFPLDAVLLPDEALPLHIFEERYKEMIGECLNAQGRGSGQQEFGVVLAKDDRIESVGCTAHIAKVTHRYDDGRLDIMTVGRRRFEILFTNEEKSYLRAGVQFFDDDVEGAEAPPPEATDRVMTLFQEIVRRLDKTLEVPKDFPRGRAALSFQLAGPLPLATELKQELLSNRNEVQRLKLLTRGIEQLIQRIDLVEKVRHRAGGNGKVGLP